MTHGVDVNINYNITKDQLCEVLTKLNLIGEQMSTLQDVLVAVSAQQDVIVASQDAIKFLVNEVRKLIALNDTAGADALLAEIEANSASLTASIIENTEIANLVDSING